MTEEATPVDVLDDPDARLTDALSKAQGAFPKIERRNKAEVKTKAGDKYTYTYADLADVLSVVRPVLSEHGLAIVQRTVRDPASRAVILLTELKHVGGGKITSEVELGQASSNPQQFGGALTYLRRYSLVTLLGIAAEEDRDAQDVEPAGRESAPSAPAWATRLAAAEDKAELMADLKALVGDERAKALAVGIAGTYDGVPVIAADVVRALRRVIAPAPDPGAEAARIAQDAAAEAAPSSDVSADFEPSQAEPEPPPAVERPPGAPAPATVEAPDLTDFGDDDELKRAALTEAGCTCADPLGPEIERDGACPIIGHGLPF